MVWNVGFNPSCVAEQNLLSLLNWYHCLLATQLVSEKQSDCTETQRTLSYSVTR